MALELQIQEMMRAVSAADAADLFMSPFVHPQLMLVATHEDGPAMWMVNRSDIYTPVLETLCHHPIAGISERAQSKINLRKNPPVDLPKPKILEDTDLANIHDHEIEEILGHPQVPWQQILEISLSPKEDHRASSALSLTRRYLEFPPRSENSDDSLMIEKLRERFQQILESDPSDFVRAYAARVPVLSPQLLKELVATETNSQVLMRLVQHPNAILASLESRILSADELAPVVATAISLDSRLPQNLRVKLLESDSTPSLAALFHEYVLDINRD